MTPRVTSRLFRLACHTRLGLADWQEIADVGLMELQVGNRSAESIALASVTGASDDLDQIAVEALEAAGECAPNDTQAAELVASEYADRILRKTISPYEGARKLWHLARRTPAIEPRLRTFIGLASEWQDDEDNRTSYDNDIVNAARELLK